MDIKLILSVFIVGLLHMRSPLAEEVRALNFTQVDMVPIKALTLGEAALIAPEHFEDLEISPGQPAQLETDGNEPVNVVLYPVGRAPEVISMKRDLRDKLGVEPGSEAVRMTLLKRPETSVEAPDLGIRIQLNSGNSESWPGMVIGAPHGDCDLYTGEIVERLTEKVGIPSVSAYGGRITFISRWIDINRPLQREPDGVGRIKPYRSWTDEAESIYHEFRSAMLKANRVPESEAGKVPLDLYIDFHGHDLTVTKPDGSKAGRVVAECMARGYKLEEVRRIKKAFDAALAAEYGAEAPPSYWGNLPEDRRYVEQGVEVEFFYSGLGGRVYGALGSEYAERAIHIESPNMMRMSEAGREKTVNALAAFTQWLRDEMPTGEEYQVPSNGTNLQPANTAESDLWITVPGGEFLMGADKNEGWSNQRPQHRVHINPFAIQRYEVTNSEYADFLNMSIIKGDINIKDGKVVSQDNNIWAALWPTSPLSRLLLEDDKFLVRDGYWDHPVVEVSWFGAQAYAIAQGARLPTEAEWEYAATWDPELGQVIRWKEPEDLQYSNLVPGNYMHSSYYEKREVTPGTTPVGTFPKGASPLGAVDMIGNAWEWTHDWYGNYKSENGVVENPQGPERGSMKIIRGGAWDTEPSVANPVFRLGVAPQETLPTLGFRLVRDIPRSGKAE